MINHGNKVLILRNGHVENFGIAEHVKNHDVTGDTIHIKHFTSWDSPDMMQVNKWNGKAISGNTYSVKVINEECLDEALKQHNLSHKLDDFKYYELRLQKQKDDELKYAKAKEWYNSLPMEQQEMVEIIKHFEWAVPMA